jgi:hypothetical protein
MVCTELQNQDDFSCASRRSSTALWFLLGWIADTFPKAVRIKPRAADGLAEMVVPEACEPVMEEIGAGAEVAEAYAMLLTADNSIQAAGDIAQLRERLESYWARHASPCALPWF